MCFLTHFMIYFLAIFNFLYLFFFILFVFLVSFVVQPFKLRIAVGLWLLLTKNFFFINIVVSKNTKEIDML